MNMEFIRSAVPPENENNQALYLIFNRGRLLVNIKGQTPLSAFPLLPLDHPFLKQLPSPCFIGTIDGFHCYCATASSQEAVDGFEYRNLRTLFLRMDGFVFEIAGYARQIQEWLTTFRFCGRCGEKNVPAKKEHVMVCPACGFHSYPRISPAIIVAVVDRDRLLLARGVDFPDKEMFSVLAGFVESGETLEACVEREVFEECGIRVTDINYFQSQPWPFPHGLMIGFTARYRSGRIRIDEKEIAEAGWFRADALPKVPGAPSLSGALISWFKAQCG